MWRCSSRAWRKPATRARSERIAELLAARYEKSGGNPERWVFRIFGPTTIALRYLDARDYDEATDWLERAFEVRSPGMPYIGCSPLYDPLRSNPRFQDLLRRMNLPTDARSDPGK